MNTWHVITSGHLSRNKFWGESETVQYHPVLATCTVVQTEHGNVVVDPSQDGEEMRQSVFNRCGLKPSDIDIVYSTHFHRDHWMGAHAFPNAAFYMPKTDCESAMALKDYVIPEHAESLARLVPIEGQIVEGLTLVPLPGHTPGLQGVLFDAPEGRVLISGDSIMNFEYFQAKEGYFYSVSLEKSRESIEKAAQIADFIVPGHGNYFPVRAYPFKEAGKPVRRAYPETNGRFSLNTPVREFMRLPGYLEFMRAELSETANMFQLTMSRDCPLYVIVMSMGVKPERAERFVELANARG